MRSRTRILIALLALLCAGMVALAQDPAMISIDQGTNGSTPISFEEADQPSLNLSPDSLVFRQLTATPPPSLKFTISARGSVALGAFTATAASTGNWLSVSPASGSGPTTLTASVNTTGLAPGEYSGSIAIAATGFPSATVKVELEIFGTAGAAITTPVSALMLRPDDLEFHASAGGTPPPPRELAIFNPAGDSFSWTAAASTTPTGGKWLTVSPLSGTGKAVLKVQVDQTGLAAGQFQGQITVTSGSNTATAKIELDLDAGAAAKLKVTPQSLNFNIEPNATKPPEARTLEVRSTGRGGPLSWTASATVDKPTGGAWLSITPTSGKTPDKISAKVNSTGLAAGTYSGRITVKAGTDSTDVQVFLRLLGPTKVTVVVSPREMKFNATTGSSGTVTPASRSIKISSTSTGLTFSATATTAKGGSWLKITPVSGTVPGSIAASVDASIATKLSPGFYTGAVQVQVPGAAKEVNTVHVGLKVFSPDEKPRLEVEPGAVSFQAIVGGSDPASKQVALIPEGAASLAWTATTTVASPTGGTWLSASPTSGTTMSGALSTVNISAAKIASLAIGTYQGTVVFTPDPASGAPVAHLKVVLVVAAAGATKTGLPIAQLNDSSSAVASGDLVAFFTSPPDGFISDLASPPNVSVTVLDSSGAAVEGANVVISSSNGEPDLVLDEVGGGQYESAFRALVSGSLTLSGSATVGGQSSASFGVSGDMEASVDRPTVIFQGGAVSAASFAAAPAPLAPGSLVTVFGQGIAGDSAQASTVPLPNSMSGVSVTVGGVAAPILNMDSSADQISLQVPFELDGQAEAEIVVNNNGVISQAETVQIATAPALFTTASSGVGPGAFLHGNGNALITASSPAAAGEVILIYATGLGAVSPSVASGDAASGAANVTGNVTVTIGGQPAQWQYAGAAPGWVGLYQLNVVVPSGVSGDALVIVSVDGTRATGQATVSVR
jgi:uncharacterized protein (TIGR03437 family)